MYCKIVTLILFKSTIWDVQLDQESYSPKTVHTVLLD